MAKVSEIRAVFTLDLKPFALGLQTALGMGHAFGKQLQPVLNLQAKPDLSVFDTQLQSIQRSTEEYIKSLQEAAQANEQFGKSEENIPPKMAPADEAVKKKTQSMGMMKRQTLQAFGALSFLVTGLVQVATNAGGGSRELNKLSQGLSQGISAGFGLASTLSLIVPGLGATAVGIGVVVAAGVALLKFFDDTEERAERTQKRLEGFSQTLRGASTEDLNTFRQGLIAASAASKKRQEEIEKQLDSGQHLNARMAGVLKKRFADEEAFGEEQSKMAREIEKELTNRQLTTAEVRARIRELEIASETNKYRKMEKEAQKAFDDEKKRLQEADASAEDRRQAIEALERSHRVKLKQIQEEEQNERLVGRAEFLNRMHEAEKKAENDRFEASLEAIRQQGLKQRLTQEQLDIQIFQARDRRLRAQLQEMKDIVGPRSPEQVAQQAELERQITENQTRESQARINLSKREKEERRRLADTMFEMEAERIRLMTRDQTRAELEITALKKSRTEQEIAQLRLLETTGKQLTAEEKQRKADLELELVRLARQGKDLRKQLWEEEHRLAIGAFDGILSGFRHLIEGMLTEQSRMTATMIAQRDNDYRLFLVDQEKRRADLQKQFKDRTLSEQEYHLRVQQLTLDQRRREEEMAAFRRQLEVERMSLVEQSWLFTRDMVTRALLDIGQEELKSYLLSLVRHEATEAGKSAATAVRVTTDTGTLAAGLAAQEALALTTIATTTAAVIASMNLIAAAAATSATLVSISTLGGAAYVGSAAVLAAVALTKAGLLIPGFEEGGKTKKGQVGFIEGFHPEIIAPEKTFYDVARGEIIPRLILEQNRYLRSEASGQTTSRKGIELDDVLNRLETIAEKLENLRLVADGDDLVAALKNHDKFTKRVGLS